MVKKKNPTSNLGKIVESWKVLIEINFKRDLKNNSPLLIQNILKDFDAVYTRIGLIYKQMGFKI